MADQTIEIRLILRDEMSKALAPIEQQLKRIGETRVDRLHGAMDRLAPAVRVVHRELSTLTRLTLGGLVGGGVIAGLAALTKSLQDMAAQNIQLRYTAQSLGVSTKFLEDYKAALVGLGESPETAASSLKKSLETLDEFMVKGSKSSLGSFLKESIGGPQIAGQLRDIIAKQGEEAGLKFLINVAKRITDRKGRAEFLRQAQLPYSAIGIDKMLSQLPERIQLSNEQVDAMAVANMQLERHSENIKLILAGELLPAITAITKSLSEYLQTEAGQKFSKQLGEIAGDISKAISTWIQEGGLESALKALEMAFGAADKVVKGIGLTWPQAIGVLVGIKFAAWLLDVAAGLAGIAKLAWVLRLLPFVAMYFGAKWFRDLVDAEGREKEALEKHPGRLSDRPGLTDEQKKNLEELQRSRPMIPGGTEPPAWFKYLFNMGGQGKPQTAEEQRAAAAEDANERKALNDKLNELAIGTGHLADYIGQTAIGGPEGTPGESGLGAGLSRGAYQTMFREGPMVGQYERIVQAAEANGLTPSLLAGIIALESKRPGAGGFGMSRATLAFLNPGGLMGGGRGNRTFQNFPDIGAGIDKTAAIAARNLAAGGGTFEGLANIYSPPVDPKTGRPYANDPHGTNREWPTHVSRFTSQLTERGFDPGGLQDAEPSGGIIRALAGDGSGGMDGRASIDIDVGGLGQPERDPSSLFKPQSLDGAVQMQNATQPQHNPLSFQ
jgi:hypothetical protein